MDTYANVDANVIAGAKYITDVDAIAAIPFMLCTYELKR